jgi:hypothetical protein
MSLFQVRPERVQRNVTLQRVRHPMLSALPLLERDGAVRVEGGGGRGTDEEEVDEGEDGGAGGDAFPGAAVATDLAGVELVELFAEDEEGKLATA